MNQGQAAREMVKGGFPPSGHATIKQGRDGPTLHRNYMVSAPYSAETVITDWQRAPWSDGAASPRQAPQVGKQSNGGGERGPREITQ